MREIAIALIACATLLPIASALPDLDDMDPEHPLRSAVGAACLATPSDGIRPGTLGSLPIPYGGLEGEIDALDGDLQEPKEWCESTADSMGDVVNVELDDFA